MRAVAILLLLLLVGAAAADRAGDELAARVFQVDGAERARTLEALVSRGRLSPGLRATFPTRETAARALAKLQAGTTRPLDPAACALIAGTGELVFGCAERGCAGSCEVVSRQARIRVRAGRWTVISTTVKRLGDTGECGCCL